MNKEEFILLYEKYLLGNCTKAEQEQLEHYRDGFILEDEKWDEVRFGDDQAYIGELYQQFLRDITPRPKIRKFHYWQIAAAIVLMLTSSVLVYINIRQKQNVQLAAALTKIKPGSNKAILTLGNGRKIILDDATKGDITVQDDIKATKVKDGQLVYEAGKNYQTGEQAENATNLLQVPNGGQYQVCLPDGTKVWLNSASSLEYPVKFSGSERRVKLTGEAYFEVAKNKAMPFIVDVNQVNIKVLGTHFNINSYDAGHIKTSLMEGSVLLSTTQAQQILKPGEAGISTDDGQIKKTGFEEDVVLAWKKGYFVYHDANINTIMQEAARWYDINVDYRGDLQNKKFWGKISRNADIEEFLKSLELTGSVHFKIEGRNVIVKN